VVDVDGATTAELEANQFSTTTKHWKVIAAAADAFGDEAAGGGTDVNTILADRRFV